MAGDKSKEPEEPGAVLTGERHLGPAEGKEEASIFENEDERHRGPLLPSAQSSDEEVPTYERDPRHKEGKYPAGGEDEASNESRHKKEEG